MRAAEQIIGFLGTPKVDPTANNLSRDVLTINSLVGYWRATDAVASPTLKDYSASGLPATIAGGVTLGSTSLVTGSIATSALFNGTTGLANLGAAGETAFHNTFEFNADWTVEALVNPTMTRTTNGETRSIFSKIQPSGNFTGVTVELYYSTALSASVVEMQLISNFGGGSGPFDLVRGTIDVPNGSVSHIVVSRKAGVTSIWVNGVADTLSTSSLALGSNSTANSINPMIGARTNAIFFKGNIQELAVYNVGVGATTASIMPSNVLSAGKPFYHYGLSLGRAPLASISVPNVILLTDMASDVDDVGDASIALALHLRGEINLIGIITDSINDRSADTAYAIAKYMIPSKTTSFVGAWQGAVPTGPSGGSAYTADISATFGANQGRASYTDGVQKLRALLAANSNVVIVATGLATVLDGLLTSAANAGGDGFGTGVALINSSVRRTVPVAGIFTAGGDFNNQNGPPANASDFAANWPGEIVFCGTELGTLILAGPPSTAPSGTNPVQQAFNDWIVLGGNTSPRPAWGMLGVLFAARGVASGLEPAGLRGTNTINSAINTPINGQAAGFNAFTWTSGNATFLRKSASDAAFMTLFNSVYAALPGAF